MDWYAPLTYTRSHIDTDGDHVTIACDEDLEAAAARMESDNPLRIFITASDAARPQPAAPAASRANAANDLSSKETPAPLPAPAPAPDTAVASAAAAAAAATSPAPQSGPAPGENPFAHAPPSFASLFENGSPLTDLLQHFMQHAEAVSQAEESAASPQSDPGQCPGRAAAHDPAAHRGVVCDGCQQGSQAA